MIQIRRARGPVFFVFSLASLALAAFQAPGAAAEDKVASLGDGAKLLQACEGGPVFDLAIVATHVHEDGHKTLSGDRPFIVTHVVPTADGKSVDLEQKRYNKAEFEKLMVETGEAFKPYRHDPSQGPKPGARMQSSQASLSTELFPQGYRGAKQPSGECVSQVMRSTMDKHSGELHGELLAADKAAVTRKRSGPVRELPEERITGRVPSGAGSGSAK